jgi:hypothetical protein
METGGGRNVFGHDPTIFIGGDVTKQRYLRYRLARGHRHMQGVGPVQLTYWSIQDAADKLGGCWIPEVNMRVGFALLRYNIARYGRERGFAAYNGSGPAAARYGRRAVVVSNQAKAVLGKKAVPHKTQPKPKKVTLPRNWWKRWVYGDVDCNRDLLVALASVAKAYQRQYGGKVLNRVRQGRRTYGEQAALYALYVAGKGNLAAKPGTSNHEFGRAGDCGIVVNGREQNIGVSLKARALMRKYGLCLPVRGEKWHVERGSHWVA